MNPQAGQAEIRLEFSLDPERLQHRSSVPFMARYEPKSGAAPLTWENINVLSMQTERVDDDTIQWHAEIEGIGNGNGVEGVHLSARSSDHQKKIGRSGGLTLDRPKRPAVFRNLPLGSVTELGAPTAALGYQMAAIGGIAECPVWIVFPGESSLTALVTLKTLAKAITAELVF